MSQEHDDFAAVTINQATAVASLATLMLAQASKPWSTRDLWLRYFGVFWPNGPRCGYLKIASAGDVVVTREGVTFTYILANMPQDVPFDGNYNDIFLHGAQDINILIPMTKNKSPSHQYIT